MPVSTPARRPIDEPFCALKRSTTPRRLLGEVDAAAHVVDARHDQPGRREVAAAKRAHLLDAGLLRGLVEAAHQGVEVADLLLAGEAAGVVVEADELGEHDRHVLVRLGDRLVALLVLRGDALGHEREQQLLVLGLLLLDQLLLDAQARRHVVERAAEVAELVARALRHLHVEVALGDAVHRADESVHRAA